MAKKLLILGGSRYILPVIDAAHEMGAEVITCDYLPDNIAHQHSDGYRNASIVDNEAVLVVAKEEGIDGIMSFAADPGVVTASYVAEQLGLPFQGSYEAVKRLQNKDLFRMFLRDHGFNCPELHVFGSVEEGMEQAEALSYPAIVKPVDSAGSKGCARVDGPEKLKSALETAFGFSRGHRCIVEQFLEKQGPSSDADGFAVQGDLACVSFTSQLFDLGSPNPYTPAAYTMPAGMEAVHQEELLGELQRLSDLLGLRDGVFNIETRVAQDGKPYIMEMSPRGGGNRLSEMLRYASQIDLVTASVEAALGLPIKGVERPDYDGFWYQEILHANRDGAFAGVAYAPRIKDNLVEEQLWVNPGDPINAFGSANHAIGTSFLRFDTYDEMLDFVDRKDQLLKVELQ